MRGEELLCRPENASGCGLDEDTNFRSEKESIASGGVLQPLSVTGKAVGDAREPRRACVLVGAVRWAAERPARQSDHEALRERMGVRVPGALHSFKY